MVGDRHRSIERLVGLVDAVAVEVRHAASDHGIGREIADAVACSGVVGGDVLDEDRRVCRAVAAAAVAGVGGAVVAGGGGRADVTDADGIGGGITGAEVAGVDRDVAVGVGTVAAAIGVDVPGRRGRHLRCDGADAEVVAGIDLYVAASIGGVIPRALCLRGDGAGREAAGCVDDDRRIRRGIAGQMPCREVADHDVALAAAQIDAAGSGREVAAAELPGGCEAEAVAGEVAELDGASRDRAEVDRARGVDEEAAGRAGRNRTADGHVPDRAEGAALDGAAQSDELTAVHRAADRQILHGVGQGPRHHDGVPLCIEQDITRGVGLVDRVVHAREC